MTTQDTQRAADQLRRCLELERVHGPLLSARGLRLVRHTAFAAYHDLLSAGQRGRAVAILNASVSAA